jgi:uncharacterized phage-like protein YoqJ
MKNQTACFTGHREIPFFQKRRLKAKVESAITDAIRNGYRYFGAGGALGFDMLAAQTVLELKADYPDIKLILVLPCLNQTRGWAQEDVKEYERIKAAADKVTYISKEYYNGCMHKRNRHLVDNSSLCICYLTKQSGGTAYTVSYAESHDLKIVNVAQ